MTAQMPKLMLKTTITSPNRERFSLPIVRNVRVMFSFTERPSEKNGKINKKNKAKIVGIKKRNIPYTATAKTRMVKSNRKPNLFKKNRTPSMGEIVSSFSSANTSCINGGTHRVKFRNRAKPDRY